MADAADRPKGLVPVTAYMAGYVQLIDMPALNECATAHDTQIYVAAVPGDWVAEGDAIANIDTGDPEVAKAIALTFTMEAIRTFDQDPRFGLQVIAGIAARALSPGINDGHRSRCDQPG